ncbi:cytochrome c biogenesis heme-transporting ATPase CcmA [uncultured Pseudoteredinibacter sp.]|uniref:cytochrome c biogenesis heme-transporting ATPase CcmA n=1 Tax=uncultured Pseudoteredinibacter sp. TaxID=1641701 RepID=UPI00260E23AA|nr:cytochrome c biogenesis heme-transporting ATPase CcmA [uncultured Pseudoteredinibacter sp.]
MANSKDQQALAISLDNIACQRDERQLFSGLSIEINAGDVLQLLGPNGAGKTTLLRCLVSLSQPAVGEIRFNGQALHQNLYAYRSQLLYLGHLAGIKSTLSPAENLRWYAGLEGDDVNLEERIETALKEVGLYGYEDQSCFNLSAGQQRRVALARLYLSKARIWVLDEPLTAIDKAGIAKLERRFAEHSASGGIVILSTHQDLKLDTLKQVDLQDYLPTPDMLMGGL